jgi:hypothetical protein
MIQIAKRSESAPPCSCGRQPMHVEHRAGNQHSFECPPCGVKTGKHPSQALALMAWRAPSKESRPLRVVRHAA